MKYKLNIYYNTFKLIIFHIILISYVNSQHKVTEIQKIKGRVCLGLQSKKYQEEKEPMTNWIEHLSKDLNIEPKQVLFICLSMCYKLIPDHLARKIHKNLGEFKIEHNDPEFMKVYDYEYYDYDNIEFIKTAYQEFQPVFELIKDEVKMQGRNFFTDFKFEATPLFKFFLLYFFVNTAIIFYKRINNPPKVINKMDDNNGDKKDNIDNDKDKDEMNKEKME